MALRLPHRLLTLIALTAVTAVIILFTSGSFTTMRGSLLESYTLFTLFDTNNDSKLSETEMRKGFAKALQEIPLQYVKYDVNRDNKVDQADLQDIIDSLRAALQSVCGNGIKESGEQCDAGTQNGVQCSVAHAGLQCTYCTTECTNRNYSPPAVCGNGYHEPGEGCDDGNTVSQDNCSSSCVMETHLGCQNNSCVQLEGFGPNTCSSSAQCVVGCGNGVREGVEQCDDGNGINADTCNNSCQIAQLSCTSTKPSCGQGGTATCCASNQWTCALENNCSCYCSGSTYVRGVTSCPTYITNPCVPPTSICGNGLREGTEQCEDKNAVSGDGCSASCAVETGFTCTGVPVSTCLPTVPVCGDGYKQGSEECDDKNRVNDDACSNVCKIAVCGDSIVQPATEQCDDGNTANGDECSASCQSTFSIASSCTGAVVFKSIGTSPAFISSILSHNDSAYAIGFVSQPDLKSKMSVYRHSKNGTGSVWLPEATLGVPSVGARATILNAGGTLFVYKQKDAGQWTEATREDLVFRRTASGQWESLGSPWKSPDIPQISSLAVLNGVPYVSVSNYGFVYRYDGNKSWTQLGTTAITNIGNLTSVYGKLYALGSFLGYNVDFSQSWVGRIVAWEGSSWMGAASMWSVKQIQADASNLLIVGRESSSDSTPWRVYRVPSDSTTTVDTHIYDAMQAWQWPVLGTVDGTLFGVIANANTLHVYPSFGQGWKNIGTFSYSDIVSTPNGSTSFDLQDGLVILRTNLTCKKVNVPTLLITCGNGLKQGAEECDDGNQVDQDFCRNSCVLARCGDSIVQGAEQCDAGGNTATCTNTCQNRPAACGDGYQQGAEQCDDGNLANGDGCTSTCATVCGDGIKKGIEQCDDGDSNDANGCKNNCRLPPPPPLICRRISCTQFASHSGVGYHQLSYLGLSNGTPYYAGCNLYGTKYLIHGLTGQITTNGTCPQSNVLTGSPVDGALATQISGMLGKSLTQPPTIVTSPTLGSYFAAINGHNSKVTIGGAGFSFQAQSCGVEEYSCDCAAPDLVDPRYCYQKASGSGYTPVCGDGSIEGTEQCDDRNTSAGDGCSSACTIEAAPAASCGAVGSPVICNNSSNPCKQSGFTVPMCKSFGATNPVVMPICCGTSTYSATGCIPADCR